MANHAPSHRSASSLNANESNLHTTKSGSIPSDQRQRETAQYISDMALELRNLARSVNLFQVMVPLEYAYYEAYAMANRVDVPQAEIERIRALEKASAESEAKPEE